MNPVQKCSRSDDLAGERTILTRFSTAVAAFMVIGSSLYSALIAARALRISHPARAYSGIIFSEYLHYTHILLTSHHTACDSRHINRNLSDRAVSN